MWVVILSLAWCGMALDTPVITQVQMSNESNLELLLVSVKPQTVLLTVFS